MTVRLGYACINLSLQKDPGGPRLKAVTAKRLSTLDARERRALLYQVGRNNLKTLAAVLRWNHAHDIRLFRVTSELVPLATHPVAAEWNWEEDLSYEFAECARLAERYGIRLTTHPGQYTVLNAPNPDIAERGMADLRYHARMLELLGDNPQSGMVLHVGGAYGNKQAGLARFVANFGRLPPNVARKLWIENDDTSWDTAEAFAVAEAIGRPMVLDIHHHRVLRSDDWLPWLERILPAWGDVRPKVHVSSPKDGERSRHHADGIDAGQFAEFLARIGDTDLDVMLECKQKDLALLRLRHELAAAPV